MISVDTSSLEFLVDYSNHLKSLTADDKRSRFGFNANDESIDKLMLTMAYNPYEHYLWEAVIDKATVGWGHMAFVESGKWELAVSVDRPHQRLGAGDRLIAAMLLWAKYHHIDEVFMHCIEDNRVIQHLAAKHNLKTIERGYGERTAAIEVPDPTFMETNSQLLKEQMAVLADIANLQKKLFTLWNNPSKTIS